MGCVFFKSVKHCPERDLDVNYIIDQISDKIFDEICDNSEMYTVFHMNSKRQLISDTLKYLNHRIYTMDIVNVVVQACANALKINLYIYMNGQGLDQYLFQHIVNCHQTEIYSSCTIFKVGLYIGGTTIQQ